jgi:hypothetical protein
LRRETKPVAILTMTKATKTIIQWFVWAIGWTFIGVMNRRMYITLTDNNMHPNIFIVIMSHIGIYIALVCWVIAIISTVGWVKIYFTGKK